MGIYEFGYNTHPRRIRRRSNLGHISRKKVRLMGREIGNCKYRIKQLVRYFRHSLGETIFLQLSPFYEAVSCNSCAEVLLVLICYSNGTITKPIHILIDEYFHWESGKISD